MKTLQQRIDAIREEFQDTRPDVVMVIDELVEKLKGLEWQDMKTAPRDGSKFIAITSYGEQCVMRFDGEEIIRAVTCRRCDGMGLGGLSHWMPLPQPPKAGE